MATITRVVKVPVGEMGHGFITHEAQGVDGIRFGIVYTSATHMYIYAKVDDTNVDRVLSWISTHNGTVLTQAEAQTEIQADIAAIPDSTNICSMGYEHPINRTQLWQDVVNAASLV